MLQPWLDTAFPLVEPKVLVPEVQRSCKAALWTAPDTKDPGDEAEHREGTAKEEAAWKGASEVPVAALSSLLWTHRQMTQGFSSLYQSTWTGCEESLPSVQ